MRAIIRMHSSELMSLRNRIKWLHTLLTQVAEAVAEPERRPFHMSDARQTARPMKVHPSIEWIEPATHLDRLPLYF